MRIDKNAPLLSKLKYSLIRIFIVAWAIGSLMLVYYWTSLSMYLKILLALIFAFTAPDSVVDVFISYEVYKTKWEKIKNNVLDNRNDTGQKS